MKLNKKEQRLFPVIPVLINKKIILILNYEFNFKKSWKNFDTSNV